MTERVSLGRQRRAEKRVTSLLKDQETPSGVDWGAGAEELGAGEPDGGDAVGLGAVGGGGESEGGG